MKNAFSERYGTRKFQRHSSRDKETAGRRMRRPAESMKKVLDGPYRSIERSISGTWARSASVTPST